MNEYSWIDDQINESYQRGVADGVEDERKRISDALLSDNTIRALFTNDPVQTIPSPSTEDIEVTRRSMRTALAAIGLGAKETA